MTTTGYNTGQTGFCMPATFTRWKPLRLVCLRPLDKNTRIRHGAPTGISGRRLDPDGAVAESSSAAINLCTSLTSNQSLLCSPCRSPATLRQPVPWIAPRVYCHSTESVPSICTWRVVGRSIRENSFFHPRHLGVSDTMPISSPLAVCPSFVRRDMIRSRPFAVPQVKEPLCMARKRRE